MVAIPAGDWEEDAHMQVLRDQKEALEDAEQYNSPETMSRKREAVKEQAKTTRSPKSLTE